MNIWKRLVIITTLVVLRTQTITMAQEFCPDYQKMHDRAKEIQNILSKPRLDLRVRSNHNPLYFEADLLETYFSSRSEQFLPQTRILNLGRFFGKIESRIGRQVPENWKEFQLSQTPKGRDVYLPAPETIKGLKLISNRSQKIDKSGFIRVFDQDPSAKSISIKPEAIRNLIPELDQNLMQIAKHKERIYIIVYRERASPFRIYCTDTLVSKIIWEQSVWAQGGPVAFTGPGWNHLVEMVFNEESITLFGAESTGVYIESFDCATGTPEFRISSKLWRAPSQSKQ